MEVDDSSLLQYFIVSNACIYVQSNTLNSYLYVIAVASVCVICALISVSLKESIMNSQHWI